MKRLLKFVLWSICFALPDNKVSALFSRQAHRAGDRTGLSLSYDIVKAQGGSIGVESHEGKGSVFTIHLPVSWIIAFCRFGVDGSTARR
ncbi:MAG: hypothetical protein R2806_24815 [Saprospiraceae bacterium]